MADPKSANTPDEYIDRLDEPRKSEIRKLHDLIRETVPNLGPYMQSGMIGYGKYHYRYASGREGDWAIIALASQKNYMSLYVTGVCEGHYVAERYKELLPKASIGKTCVRIKRIADVDADVVQRLIKEGAEAMREQQEMS